MTYKILRDPAPSYLEELTALYNSTRPLHSQNAGLLVVTRIFNSRMEFRFSLLRNQLPVLIQEADSLSTIRLELKPFSLRKLLVSNSVVTIIILVSFNNSRRLELDHAPKHGQKL